MEITDAGMNTNTAGDSSNITLDPSILQEKNETYSSLTDTNGVDLFTDKYEKWVETVKTEEENQNRQIEKVIFNTGSETEQSEYERVQNRLFLNTQPQVKKEIVGKGKNQTGMAVATVGIILIVFFLVLFSFSEKRRKRRRTDAINTYRYE